MAQRRQRFCRKCGLPETNRRPLSKRGFHYDCGKVIVADNLDQLVTRSGKYYERWRRGYIAFAERIAEQ